MVVDLFIRSYWKDLEWLRFCLASIERHCLGFRATIVVLPRSSQPWLRKFKVPDHVRIEWCRPYRDDYLGQQVTKLMADTYTDATHICHIDSDCIFNRGTSPEDLFVNSKPRVLHRPYDLLGRHHPWQLPTEKFLGIGVRDDFMQHPPFLFPRWLYPQVREHSISTHGVDIETYVTTQIPRGFSEFNVLGALAWQHFRDNFHWVDTSSNPACEPHCRWYWSWGGMDDTIRSEIKQSLDPLPASESVCRPS